MSSKKKKIILFLFSKPFSFSKKMSASNSVTVPSQRDEDQETKTASSASKIDESQQQPNQTTNDTNNQTAIPVALVTCGICLEDFSAKDMATLVCCNQQLCLVDAIRVGTCPFCRQEPCVWFPGV